VPMLKKPSTKYRRFPKIELRQRRWPGAKITYPPRWCSVDLHDGNRALFEPTDSARKRRMFHIWNVFQAEYLAPGMTIELVSQKMHEPTNANGPTVDCDFNITGRSVRTSGQGSDFIATFIAAASAAAGTVITIVSAQTDALGAVNAGQQGRYVELRFDNGSARFIIGIAADEERAQAAAIISACSLMSLQAPPRRRDPAVAWSGRHNPKRRCDYLIAPFFINASIRVASTPHALSASRVFAPAAGASQRIFAGVRLKRGAAFG